MYQIHEDFPYGCAFLLLRDLTLGGVSLGNREEVGGAELFRDRPHPVDELLEPRAGRDGGAALEVDELARQAVADRAPEVLLDEPVRQLGQRLALVERARDARGERVRERGEGARSTRASRCPSYRTV